MDTVYLDLYDTQLFLRFRTKTYYVSHFVHNMLDVSTIEKSIYNNLLNANGKINIWALNSDIKDVHIHPPQSL